MEETLRITTDHLKNELRLMENRLMEIKKTINMINRLNGELPAYPEYELIESATNPAN